MYGLLSYHICIESTTTLSDNTCTCVYVQGYMCVCVYVAFHFQDKQISVTLYLKQEAMMNMMLMDLTRTVLYTTGHADPPTITSIIHRTPMSAHGTVHM